MAQVNALVRCVAFALTQSHVAVAMPAYWGYDERNPDAIVGFGPTDGDAVFIPDDVGSEILDPTQPNGDLVAPWDDALDAGEDEGPEPPLPEVPVFLTVPRTAPEFNPEPEPAFVEDWESSDFSDDSNEIRAEAAVFTPKGLRRSSLALVRRPVAKKLVRKPVAGARNFYDEEEEDFDQESGDFIDEEGRLVREDLMFDEDEAEHLPGAYAREGDFDDEDDFPQPIGEWEFDTGSSGAAKLASAAALLALLA